MAARLEYIATYHPRPWQVPVWRDTTSLIILLTGGAGGGKSRIAAEKLHGYCKRYAGAFALTLRKVKASMTNSTVAFLEQTVIGRDPGVTCVVSKSRFEYSNGSMLAWAGLEDDLQLDRLKSIGPKGGVDIAWMEEANEFDERDVNAVLARLRGTAGSWRQLLLTTNPDAPLHWIYRRLILGGEATVYESYARDNPANAPEYLQTLARLTGIDGERLRDGKWVQASGLVYDTWREAENVSEAAEYQPGGGAIYWFVDDGYAGSLDVATQQYSAQSHPRAILLCQQRANGQLCIFAESYAVHRLSDQHIAEVLALGYPAPDCAIVDKSAAELKGRLHDADILTRNGAATVEESIKVCRSYLASDTQGWQRVLVHPRCRHLRAEMASYRRDAGSGEIVKAFDHGPDALRYGCWALREAA